MGQFSQNMFDFLTVETLRGLIFLVFLDYFLAVLWAIREKRFSSEVGIKGVTQKLALITLLFAVFYFKHSTTASGLIDLLALQGLVTGVVLTEVVSIRRNLEKLGLNLVVWKWVPKDVPAEEAKSPTIHEEGKKQ